MNKNEKELLFKDLSARLPYHVRVKVWLTDGTTEEGFLDLEHNYADVLRDAFYYNKIIDIKPYLRPMSSMTEEEKSQYNFYLTRINFAYDASLLIDWLNAHHFDHHNLIEKGLAIEVTEENNHYKNKNYDTKI